MQPLDIDGVNGARFIMKEAAVTQTDFRYFSQNRAKFSDMAEPIELEVEDQKYLMQGYKYHIWKINDSINVCIRSAVHSQLPSGDSCNLFVLPEWNEKRQPWSKDLDAMTAVMFTNEIHDNSCKFSRWTVQSVLGGVTKMRFGFC